MDKIIDSLISAASDGKDEVLVLFKGMPQTMQGRISRSCLDDGIYEMATALPDQRGRAVPMTCYFVPDGVSAILSPRREDAPRIITANPSIVGPG